MRDGRTRVVTRGILLLAALAWMLAARAGAQTPIAEQTATPESTAEHFLGAVRAIRWSDARNLLHPDALARFHELVRAMVELDPTGEARTFLSGEDSAGFAALDAPEVFERAIGTMVDSMPGFMHALFDHDDEVMGHVAESRDTAHVVYRTTPRISGGVSEVQVMQLARTLDGWRVLWSDELEALDGALRGVMLGRRRGGATR